MAAGKKQLERAQRDADWAYYRAWAEWRGGPIPELKHTLQLTPTLYNVEHPFWEAMRSVVPAVWSFESRFGFPIFCSRSRRYTPRSKQDGNPATSRSAHATGGSTLIRSDATRSCNNSSGEERVLGARTPRRVETG